MPRPATSSEPLMPGMQIGRYELIRPLAVGGMAEIFLARATGIEGFEKLVVIKRILPHLATSDEFVAMFLDEARLAATLHHANVAQVYDIGNDGGSYFFAMEYIEGKDVRHIRKQLYRSGGTLPLEHAVGIVLAVATGLHAAHEKRGRDGTPLNIVHRDVSPSNVIVTFDGGVKLIDFGIAKAAQRQTHTRTGVLKGKSAYMSPEQWTGERIDRRSDVFALGILLYELVAGGRLFRKGVEYETMRQIIRGAPALAGKCPAGFPAPLRHIADRALQRRPADRYETAEALCIDLERFAREERLPVSSFGLSAFVNELFPDEGPAAAAGEPMAIVEPDSGPVVHDAGRIDGRYAVERAVTVLADEARTINFTSGEIDVDVVFADEHDRAESESDRAETISEVGGRAETDAGTTSMHVPLTRVLPATRVLPPTRIAHIDDVAPPPSPRWLTVSVAAAAAVVLAVGAWYARDVVASSGPRAAIAVEAAPSRVERPLADTPAPPAVEPEFEPAEIVTAEAEAELAEGDVEPSVEPRARQARPERAARAAEAPPRRAAQVARAGREERAAEGGVRHADDASPQEPAASATAQRDAVEPPGAPVAEPSAAEADAREPTEPPGEPTDPPELEVVDAPADDPEPAPPGEPDYADLLGVDDATP